MNFAISTLVISYVCIRVMITLCVLHKFISQGEQINKHIDETENPYFYRPSFIIPNNFLGIVMIAMMLFIFCKTIDINDIHLGAFLVVSPPLLFLIFIMIRADTVLMVIMDVRAKDSNSLFANYDAANRFHSKKHLIITIIFMCLVIIMSIFIAYLKLHYLS